VPIVRLTEVFRQAAQSRIVTTAHAINAGRVPDLSRLTAVTISTLYRPLTRNRRCRGSSNSFPDASRSASASIRLGISQVLCPMNRGGVGARSLNIELQAALNPVGDKRVERFGWTFAPRDKVMQIENDYDRDVYNGDIGIIEDVDLDEGEVAVNFDGRTLSFVFGELDTLVARLCGHDPQEPGLGIPRRGHSGDDPALRNAAAEPHLHRRYPRQETRGAGWPEENSGDCREKHLRAKTIVEAG